MITALVCGGLTAITLGAFHVVNRLLARDDMPLALSRRRMPLRAVMAVSW